MPFRRQMTGAPSRGPARSESGLGKSNLPHPARPWPRSPRCGLRPAGSAGRIWSLSLFIGRLSSSIVEHRRIGLSSSIGAGLAGGGRPGARPGRERRPRQPICKVLQPRRNS
jgi:hypothetical protein